jgi:monoterpene epsilon-lactone hydrolase
MHNRGMSHFSPARSIQLLAVFIAFGTGAIAQDRSVPARTIPTPTTVSPELQRVIAAPWAGGGGPATLTAAQWKDLRKQGDEAQAKALQATKQRLGVSVTAETIAGVQAYRVKPAAIAPENRNRILVHVHGGAYVFGGGEAAAAEAVLMAHYGKIEIVSVDYRMAPDFPYPAALDDAVAVWKEVAKSRNPGNIGLFGTSTGGGMTLALVLKLKELTLPLPGAIMAGTPWADLTKTGDTYFTNEFVDNVLGTNDGLLEAAAKLYAGTHNLKEPLLSPVYGDFTGFPPAILISGTRDLFLSNTVRVHQKLLQAGAIADLLVFEGQSHAQYMVVPEAPETKDAWTEVSRFFSRHLKP